MMREILEKLLCIATDDLGYVYSEDGKRDITQALASIKAELLEKLPKPRQVRYEDEVFNDCLAQVKRIIDEVCK